MGQKKLLIFIIVILIVIAGGILAWYYLQDDLDNNTNTETTTNISNDTSLDTIKGAPEKNVVWVMDGTFNPSVVTTKVGDTITWVNKDEISRQVASDPHPSHSALPALESDPLSLGDEFSFTFNEAGTWYYHDHLSPINKGAVIVE